MPVFGWLACGILRLASRFGSCDRTVDVMIIGSKSDCENRHAGNHADPKREHHDQGARRWALPEVARDPRRQQPNSERENDVTARGKRPPIEPHFGYRPNQRADQHRRVNPQCRPTSCRQKYAGDQDPETSDQIICRPSEHDEPNSAAAKRHSDQGIDKAGYLQNGPDSLKGRHHSNLLFSRNAMSSDFGAAEAYLIEPD